ncbi:hypothetical protein ONZ45_g14377 [Pleurotus djamor]|nr:hypothetical protein ONZ45_g14377 [Pleurotus djamor]
MNKNMDIIMPVIIEELISAINTSIRLNETQWQAVQTIDIFADIVCSSANRAFVGLPLCRDKRFREINIQFNSYVVYGAAVIGLFPRILSPVIAAFWNRIYRIHDRLLPILKPVINIRRQLLQEYGQTYPDKPNDMLSWILEASPPDESDELIILRMLSLNFMTLHSTTLTLVHVLYHLAAEPHYVLALREDITTNFGPTFTSAQNWNRAKLDKCWKLDSFLKESQRLNGLVALTLTRRTMIPFRFADGTEVPAGCIVAATPTATHTDETIYPSPHIFDGFRFSDIREKLLSNNKPTRLEDEKVCFTNTGHNYLSFGGGRHAW